MNKPFAITLDIGSSLANKTGSWRTERPVYVDPAGYLIEVGVRPHDRWLELAMWLLVLVVVGWNVASLAVWWRARRA